MRKNIVNWIKKEVKKTGAKGIVLGLSGGIDSCVAAALAKEALGKENVLGLILPIHSDPRDAMDARAMAKKLKIPFKTLDLSRPHDELIKIFPEAKGVARVNIKPRLRMLTIYYFANKLNYLVCGTGNKCELMVGYFTKHGDGAVDILPLGALLKSQVRQLARELGVPGNIIEKPPTAGLWQGQTDEGEMGITYNELDDILDRLQNSKKQTLPQAKVKKVKSMIERSSHKRCGPKICMPSR